MSNFGQPPQSPMTGAATKPHRGALLIGLAVAGWAVCAFCSPVAFFMARADRKEIAAGQMDSQGAGLTTAAYYLSLVHMVLFGVAMCGSIAAAVVIPALAPDPPAYDTTGY